MRKRDQSWILDLILAEGYAQTSIERLLRRGVSRLRHISAEQGWYVSPRA